MDRKKSKYPPLLAGGLVIAVSLWMLSGLGSEPATLPATGSSAANGSNNNEASRVSVRVQTLHAHDITRQVVLSARTEPNRMVEIKAEAEGVVTSIAAERGQRVAAGAVLFTLDERDRQARLQEAVALVKQHELQFQALENLSGRQFSTEVQMAEARAQLESARASQALIELEIRNTTVTAPFAGTLYERSVEIGDFVRVGDSVAEFVDLDPLIIAGEVNERDVAALGIGSTGKAIVSDGVELEGRIRYLAPVANTSTRSFLVELAVPNPDGAILAGASARLQLQGNDMRVHTISAGLLSLADDGTIGVKVIDDNDTVHFYPVEVVGSTLDGMHVSGLPDTIRLITVGQGFVTEGQQVEPTVAGAVESGRGGSGDAYAD